MLILPRMIVCGEDQHLRNKQRGERTAGLMRGDEEELPC